MSGLSQDAKLLVAQARGQGGPSAEERARLHARLAPAWAAYEKEQRAQAARGSRAWWSASATRWLLCVSLSWLAPQLDDARAALVPSVQAGAVVSSAPEALRDSPPSAAKSDAERPRERLVTLPPTAASVASSSALRPARAGAASASVRAASKGPSPRARELARAAGGASLARAGDARETERAASEAAPALEASPERAPATQPVRVARLASTRRLQPTAAEEPDRDELERVDRPPPEQAGPQISPQPIGDELELLGAAQDALRKHQPSAALRLVQQHAFRFPRGALRRERQAVQILALCALQRLGPARAVFEDLSQDASESPTLESVRRACGF